ncbi:MAG: hypothetical protein Kow0056_08100 [Coriobacteriia bacterium]
MCEFCTQHGDGAVWYLNAQNYAADLLFDLERRGYIIDFVREFDSNVSTLLKGLRVVEAAPQRVAERAKRVVMERQKKSHWGQPVPIEDCERIFDIATSIVQIPCVCRRFSGTPEKGYCLVISVQPMDDILMEAFPEYAEGPDSSGFQRLSKEDALALLRRTEAEGMMHSVWTFMTPFIAGLCNCNLESGCVAMRLAVEFEAPNMWRGEKAAAIDWDLCTGCRECVSACPFGVIAYDHPNRRASVEEGDCWGCGTCRAACSEDAISLAARAMA